MNDPKIKLLPKRQTSMDMLGVLLRSLQFVNTWQPEEYSEETFETSKIERFAKKKLTVKLS